MTPEDPIARRRLARRLAPRPGRAAPRRRSVLLAGALVISASGCAVTAEDAAPTTPTTTASTALPDPPWRRQPKVPASGVNRRLLDELGDADGAVGDCEPMGLEPGALPAADEARFEGFAYQMAFDDQPVPRPRQQTVLRARATSYQRWSDGSISMNVTLVDGTHRFDVYVPSADPVRWCTYVYAPTTADETGDEIVAALRLIEPGPAATDDDRDAPT